MWSGVLLARAGRGAYTGTPGSYARFGGPPPPKKKEEAKNLLYLLSGYPPVQLRVYTGPGKFDSFQLYCWQKSASHRLQD